MCWTGQADRITQATSIDPILPNPPPAPSASNWLVPAAIATVLVLWASAFIAIRALAESFSPGSLALGRLTVGSIALGAVALGYRRPLPRGTGLWMVMVYGVLWFAGYTVVLNTAGHHLDAGTSAMLVNIAPVLVAIAAGLFMGEGFPRTLLVGIVIAFGGVSIIAIGGIGGHTSGFGVFLGVVTAVLYASGVLTQKIALRTVDAVTATWLGCAVGTVALLPFLPQTIAEVSQASTGAVIAVVYLGVFPTAIAFTLWAYALTNTSAGRLASTTLAVPAIAVMMSWLVLGETPTTLALAGGALCLLGVAISRRRPAPPSTAPAPPAAP